MKVSNVRITLTAAVLIVFTATAWALNDAFVTVQSLTADLESRNIDRIDRSLNDIKTMSYKGQILPFIADLWEQRKDKHSGLPWDVIESEIIRVELADILLQAWKNGRLKLDPQPMHRLVTSLVTNNDPDVARKAIGALSIVDDEADVESIYQVAKQKDPATFRVAVMTLSSMCNQKAARAMAQLEKSITEPHLKSYIVERKQRAAQFKKETEWCNPARSNVISK